MVRNVANTTDQKRRRALHETRLSIYEPVLICGFGAFPFWFYRRQQFTRKVITELRRTQFYGTGPTIEAHYWPKICTLKLLSPSPWPIIKRTLMCRTIAR